MAGYIGNKSSVVSSGAERKFKFTITETTTTLSNLVYTPTLVHVFHNGIRLVDGTDYTATNGTSITLTNAAENGDEVVVVSYASFQTSDTVSASAGGTFGGNVTVNADLTVSGNTDINGGTIDGTVIGGSTPAAISGTTGTFSGNLTVDTNTLFVDAANNRVGIGTSNPSTTLEVSAPTTNGQALIGQLLFKNSSGSYSSGTDGVLIFPFSDGNVYINNFDGGFVWRTGANTERMRIDASGNLLVGTTASGAVGHSFAGSGYYITRRSGTSISTHIEFRNDNGGVGAIYTNGSTTTYSTSSDYRLKEDVQPMVGATDRLMALKPVNFAWKVDGSRVDGFLAHEAQEVVPEAVVGTKDAVDADGNPEYQGIDQSKIVPLLTAALQEALTKINDQQSALELLEARVAQLEGGAA